MRPLQSDSDDDDGGGGSWNDSERGDEAGDERSGVSESDDDDDNEPRGSSASERGDNDGASPQPTLLRTGAINATRINTSGSARRRSSRLSRAQKFLHQLPRIEQFAVWRLQAAVRRMLAAETVFGWSREFGSQQERDNEAPHHDDVDDDHDQQQTIKCDDYGRLVVQPSTRLLATTCNFIARVLPPTSSQHLASFAAPEAVYNTCTRSLIFCGDTKLALDRLVERLANTRINYVQLRRHNEAAAMAAAKAECQDDESSHEEEMRFVQTRHVSPYLPSDKAYDRAAAEKQDRADDSDCEAEEVRFGDKNATRGQI